MGNPELTVPWLGLVASDRRIDGYFAKGGWISAMTAFPCPYPARAARRSDCGGWPKARMKARRIRSGSRKPVVLRDALDRLAGGLHALPRHLDAQPLHRL